MTANNVVEDEIDCQNMRYSGMSRRQLAASDVEEDMMIVMGVVHGSNMTGRVWSQKRTAFE
jgi:hypothetical protein